MRGVPNAPGPSLTLGLLGPSHQWCRKSRASLQGPPCAHGVAGTPQGEVRNSWTLFRLSLLCPIYNRNLEIWFYVRIHYSPLLPYYCPTPSLPYFLGLLEGFPLSVAGRLELFCLGLDVAWPPSGRPGGDGFWSRRNQGRIGIGLISGSVPFPRPGWGRLSGVIFRVLQLYGCGSRLLLPSNRRIH